MFWDDILLVTEQIEKYGLRGKFVDIGGLDHPCIADYDLTIATGDQNARYVTLNQRPFDHIDPLYVIINPEKGDPPIEDLPYLHHNSFGTATCLNVLEHVQNPFRVFAALYQVMQQNSLLIIETVFSFPYHPSPIDYWRYSPDCLRYLSESAGFNTLECDWRIIIPADKGILDTQKYEPQEIRSVYATLTKGNFIPQKNEKKFILPIRSSKNEDANKVIEKNQTPAVAKIDKDASRPVTESKNEFNILDYHKLNVMSNEILMNLAQNPQIINLRMEDLAGKTDKQKMEFIAGEYFAKVAGYAGKIASELLFRSQWGYGDQDWFDHRHHLLDAEKHFTDFWTLSADNVLRVLPLNGKLLDLCAGDGFYDYYFYRKRASEITCVEMKNESFRYSVRLHSAENIKHLNEDVLVYEPEESYYDVVLIRGAIEHFSQEEQYVIFKKALKALKINGYFCGDTVANPASGQSLLPAHENEWKNEIEMRQELSKFFKHVETYSYESKERTTLFWQCKKIE